MSIQLSFFGVFELDIDFVLSIDVVWQKKRRVISNNIEHQLEFLRKKLNSNTLSNSNNMEVIIIFFSKQNKNTVMTVL